MQDHGERERETSCKRKKGARESLLGRGNESPLKLRTSDRSSEAATLSSSGRAEQARSNTVAGIAGRWKYERAGKQRLNLSHRARAQPMRAPGVGVSPSWVQSEWASMAALSMDAAAAAERSADGSSRLRDA